jgi:hypothetical protein
MPDMREMLLYHGIILWPDARRGNMDGLIPGAPGRYPAGISEGDRSA